MRKRRTGFSRSWARAAFLGTVALLAYQGAAGAVPPSEAGRAALPEAIRTAGVLRVATALVWPPFDFKSDAGQPDGLDIRLVSDLAERLGLKITFEDLKFPNIVPGIATGRFDVGVDQILITDERRKTLDFVPYIKSSFSLLVGSAATGLDIDHLCGHTLALTQGSAQIAVAQRLSAKCVAQGQKPIEFLSFTAASDSYLSVANARTDGFITDKAIGLYIASKNPKLKMTEATLDEPKSMAGIALKTGNGALQKALSLALEDAVADGSYRRLLSDYGVVDDAVTVQDIQSVVVPGTLPP